MNVSDLICASPWYQHTPTIIPLPRIHQHHLCFIESATDAQVLLANIDPDYPYSNSVFLHLGGVKQQGIKHLAQGCNTLALAGYEPTAFWSLSAFHSARPPCFPYSSLFVTCLSLCNFIIAIYFHFCAGLPTKDFRNLQTHYLHSHGHEQMLTFMNLRKLGLYTEQVTADVSKMSVKDVKSKLTDKALMKKTAFKGLCKKFNLVSIEIWYFIHVQWWWFSMSTRNLIVFGQSSAHTILDNRWIPHAAITWCSCVLYTCKSACVHRVLNVTFVRKCKLCGMTNVTWWFWLLGLKHLFSRGL